MPSKIMTFEDGSSITWKDRETLEYQEPGYSVLIWVDFEAGFFKSGRIIKLHTLTNWNVFPVISSSSIPIEKRDEIVNKIRQYYGKNLRVEEG